MKNNLKALSVIIFSLCFATLAGGIEAPSYNEVFTQQLKCNSTYFSSPMWDKKLPLLARMNTKTIVVISNPIITELPLKAFQSTNPDYNGTKDRIFKVSSTRYSAFSCGPRKPVVANKAKGVAVETLINISETKRASDTFQITAGEPGDILGSDPKLYSDFLYSAADDDSNSGMFCVVLIDDFLSNPNAINIDKLCSGKSPKDLEITKKVIDQARVSWKSVIVNNQK